jgi:5'-AMP-activated protein kinase catalytic alpha subunit
MNPKIEPESESKNIVGSYRLEHTLGTGTFGKVKLGVHLPTQEKVAVKILEKSKITEKDDLSRVMREMKFLKTLNHLNIIKIFEVRIELMN